MKSLQSRGATPDFLSPSTWRHSLLRINPCFTLLTLLFAVLPPPEFLQKEFSSRKGKNLKQKMKYRQERNIITHRYWNFFIFSLICIVFYIFNLHRVSFLRVFRKKLVRDLLYGYSFLIHLNFII